eukprot:COSAG01_NODE_13843_length_1527_cov_4.240896_1_plen_242_part_00
MLCRATSSPHLTARSPSYSRPCCSPARTVAATAAAPPAALAPPRTTASPPRQGPQRHRRHPAGSGRPRGGLQCWPGCIAAFYHDSQSRQPGTLPLGSIITARVLGTGGTARAISRGACCDQYTPHRPRGAAGDACMARRADRQQPQQTTLRRGGDLEAGLTEHPLQLHDAEAENSRRGASVSWGERYLGRRLGASTSGLAYRAFAASSSFDSRRLHPAHRSRSQSVLGPATATCRARAASR